MNNIDKTYTALLQDILDNGVEKKDRTGTGTISVFGRQIRHKMSEGFPLLTTKKLHWKSIVTELLWFLRGETNIKFLVDNGCHIWDGDCYANYLKLTSQVIPFTKDEFINHIKNNDEFAHIWGELGPIYGKQWRSWKTIKQGGYQLKNGKEGTGATKKHIDQIANLINDLKTNPDSRRLMVSAWNVGELDQMVLPPCHYGFQVYTRELSLKERMILCEEKLDDIYDDGQILLPSDVEYIMNNEWKTPKRAISLMFNMRSTDVGLGLGFNLASYGLLLMMIAKQVNMVPDELVYNGGDVHLYLNHIEPIKEQLTREPYPLPTVKISNRVVNDISEYTLDDFTLENYQYHPTIRMPLSN